ncbi:MAG: cytochrome c maturation protein CcmE [Myxococcales bacterium]|nr:cytochrome c maturation protein CcmE [Myxococcales bacterium]
MSKLDQELADAVTTSEENSPVSERPVAAAKAAPTADASRKKRLQNVGLLTALLVMGGGILTLVLTSFEQSAIYSKGVDELVAEKATLGSRNVRVAGNLVKGTLKKRDEPCEYRFTIVKNEKTLDVRYAQCVVPDTFRDVPGMDVEVTAEGKLNDEGYFEANQIMAKCPSKYEMKDRAQKGEKTPHEQVLPAAAQNERR